MAQSKLLLLKPVDKLGDEGDEVTVKAGFARNFLIPRNFALPFSRANSKQIEALQRSREARKQREIEAAEAVKGKLEKVSIAFAVKTGKDGKDGEVKLFGSITAADIIKRLAEEGIEIEKKHVHLEAPVKSLGQHKATIKLHREPAIHVELAFEVVSENPIEDGEGA